MNTPEKSAVQLMTAKEAAALLAVSERTLWTLTKAGTIPCIRLGRSIRYRLSELAATLAKLSEGKGAA